MIDLPPSNFNSGDPFSARWSYRELPVDNICATQGAGFLRRLYLALNVDPLPIWGSELQSALIAKASSLRDQSANPAQWLPVIRALQSDLASTRTSSVGHVFGIYVAYYLESNRRLDAISLPASTILLHWGVAPANDGGLNDGAVVCIDPLLDQPFLTVTSTDIQESSTGIRVGDGRPVPPGQNTIPNSAVIGIGGLVVIGLFGAGAWWLFGRTPSRSNPTLTREKIDGLRMCWQRCEADAVR